MPPVFGVILEMLASIGCDLEDKLVTILSNSEIFGGSLAKVLECRGAKTTVCGADDPEISAKCQEADILISVIGRPLFVKQDMIKEEVIIIDVGITREMGTVYGDVDFNDVKDKAAFISPVPGGVGPMTVAITLRNVLEMYKRRN
jgi:methylenetetrahydrofolate dehydrogenase (NADP+)/methenyltetrahydrofolate cyclohydrolase